MQGARWRNLLGPSNVALAVLSVAAIVLLVLAVQKQYAPPPSSSLGVATPAPPSVAFIGDSFTSGTRDGGLGPANYTALLGVREGWTVTNVAADGAGYVAAPLGGGPLATQVARVVATRPSLVVVAGARPDVTENPADVRAAADGLYRDLRVQLPQARIVVVGPIWPGEDAPEEMLRVRDSVRDAAAAAQLPFLDPIRDEWFLAPEDPGITPDRQHLNDTGHKGMADLVGEGLRRTGASPA